MREVGGGRARRVLGPLLHEVEGVERRAALVAGGEFGQCFVLRFEAGLAGALLRSRQEVQRGVRRLRDRADARFEGLAGDGDGGVPLDGALDLSGYVRPLDLHRAGDDSVGPLQAVLQEGHGAEHRVDDAEIQRLLGLEGAVVAQRVLDDDLEGVLDADEVRQDPGAAPPRDDAEEHLGESERGSRRIDRAVVGVERDLHAAAEREPVDEHEGRHAGVVELAERLVAELRQLLRVALRPDGRDLRQVGTGGEEERLAGHADRLDLAGGGSPERPHRQPLGDLAGGGARPQAVERLAELDQGDGAEGRRATVVAVVVEGDERQDAAGGKRHVADVRVGDHLVVRLRDEFGDVDHQISCRLDECCPSKCGFSQMTLPPCPRPMHMAVRP